MEKILILHGPNLNLLGLREPAVYGSVTLDQINSDLEELAARLIIEIEIMQSNHEGLLVDRIQNARSVHQGIVINAGSLTHTSIALRDALAGVALPFIEVHISNVYGRETFRQHSYLAAIASGIVIGFGPEGYLLALEGLVRKLRSVS